MRRLGFTVNLCSRMWANGISKYSENPLYAPAYNVLYCATYASGLPDISLAFSLFALWLQQITTIEFTHQWGLWIKEARWYSLLTHSSSHWQRCYYQAFYGATYGQCIQHYATIIKENKRKWYWKEYLWELTLNICDLWLQPMKSVLWWRVHMPIVLQCTERMSCMHASLL